MATPPKVPDFDKGRFAAVPLLAKFWELVLDFLRTTSQALDGGLVLGENVAGATVEVTLDSTTSFPYRQPNPLKGGQRAAHVLVGAVFYPDAPDTAVPTSVKVTVGGDEVSVPVPAGVSWTLASDGALLIQGATGIPTARKVVLRLLVLPR